MPRMYDEYVTPAELTGYSRAALADLSVNQFALAQFLPNNTINDLTYRFNQGGGGLTEAANYRAYDTEPDFGSREGISRVTGSLPPIARQMLLNEFDQLVVNGNVGQEMRDLLLRDSERLTKQIAARIELARGDALVNGSVTISERGVQATVNFNRSASHTVALPAGTTQWNNLTTATPLDNIDSWITTYVATNGVRPEVMLMSRSTANMLVRNDQVSTGVFGPGTERRVTRSMLNDFLGEMEFPRIVTYDAQVNRNGVATRVIPEDRVILLPAAGDANDPETGSLGATLWGTTVESREPAYGIEGGNEPGIVVGAFKNETTPVQVITIASAIALPILANPNLSFVADVR